MNIEVIQMPREKCEACPGSREQIGSTTMAACPIADIFHKQLRMRRTASRGTAVSIPTLSVNGSSGAFTTSNPLEFREDTAMVYLEERANECGGWGSTTAPEGCKPDPSEWGNIGASRPIETEGFPEPTRGGWTDASAHGAIVTDLKSSTTMCQPTNP